MALPRAGAHLLHLSLTNYRPGAHAIFVFERSLQHHGDDLHVTMWMCRKTIPRLHPVFIDHPQAAEPHVLWIVIIAEGKCVVRVQPAMVGVAAFFAPSYLN